jgi:anti-sigma B factor antagonist
MAIQNYADRSHGPDRLTVELVDAEEPILLKLSGELDISTAPVLQARSRYLGSVIAADVLMDLDRLTFRDSSGISVIVMVCKRVRANGDSFSVMCSEPLVRRTLEFTGLLEYWQVA